jgi:hypothetical protein
VEKKKKIISKKYIFSVWIFVGSGLKLFAGSDAVAVMLRRSLKIFVEKLQCNS